MQTDSIQACVRACIIIQKYIQRNLDWQYGSNLTYFFLDDLTENVWERCQDVKGGLQNSLMLEFLNKSHMFTDVSIDEYVFDKGKTFWVYCSAPEEELVNILDLFWMKGLKAASRKI